MRYKVFAATSTKMAMLWGVVLCSLVENNQCFREAYHFHQQDYKQAGMEILG
jgi:hypothetical protein